MQPSIKRGLKSFIHALSSVIVKMDKHRPNTIEWEDKSKLPNYSVEEKAGIYLVTAIVCGILFYILMGF